MKKERFYLKRKNLYSYSFSPYIFSIYKDDLLQLVELIKENYPQSRIFFGKDGLDFEIHSRIKAEELLKNEELRKETFNSLYIKITTGDTSDSPYLIIELDKYSFNYIIMGKDKKLNQIKNEVLKIFKRHRVYRFINNKITKTIILIFDVLLFLFVFKFKTYFEKKFNINISYISILLTFFIINLAFVLPSGKNRIFLRPKKEVPIFKRCPETINLILIFLLFISLFVVGYFFKLLEF